MEQDEHNFERAASFLLQDLGLNKVSAELALVRLSLVDTFAYELDLILQLHNIDEEKRASISNDYKKLLEKKLNGQK